MMDQSSNAPVSGSPVEGNERIMAIVSLVLGVINLCAWFLPICGIPLGIIGVVLGVLGMKSPSQKTLAIIGIVLSAIGILLACINAIAGVFMGPQIQELLNQF
jgi:membrane-bound ClpP family serine protease